MRYSPGAAGKTDPADIVVAIPCYNEAGTIASVVSTVARGLARYYPELRSVLLVSDGGSTDGTRAAAESVELPGCVQRLFEVHAECPGKGAGLALLFEAAGRYSARACATFDADLRSIEESWVGSMLDPVLGDGFDFVAPHYRRDKWDGTITNHICYPVTRALFGFGVRQPIGGEFAFSGDVARVYRRRAATEWDADTSNFGVDIWMTMTAIAEGARICQARLGPKVHKAKDPADLTGMFGQVVRTLFRMLVLHRETWGDSGAGGTAPVVGRPGAGEPEPIGIDRSRLRRSIASGRQRFAGHWGQLLEPGTCAKLRAALSEIEKTPFEFPVDLWARVVCELGCAAVTPGEFPGDGGPVDAMIPLYLARALAFVGETDGMDAPGAEAAVERGVQAFERQRSFLTARMAEGSQLSRTAN